MRDLKLSSKMNDFNVLSMLCIALDDIFIINLLCILVCDTEIKLLLYQTQVLY